MKDILDIAKSQEGIGEVGGTSKYGKWLDAQVGTHLYYNLDWCGAFQLWLLKQAGQECLDAAGGLHREFAEVQVWYDAMHKLGRVTNEARPKRLVWYDWAGTPAGANHIGMVASVSGDRMKVWEGNHNNRVELVDRPIDGQVMAFGEWLSHVPGPTPVVVDEDCWVA